MNKLEKYIILGHVNPDIDSVISGYLLEKLLLSLGLNAQFIIPDKVIEKEVINICNNFGLKIDSYMKELPNDKSYKYILVDHHERQTPGFIVGIIDHHPSNAKMQINWYQNIPSSSTSCIICKENEKYFNEHDIELAILATMVDTASFHSTKTVQSDIEWVKEICRKCNVDYNKLYKVGLCLTDISNLDDARFNGLKKYNFNDLLVESSYIQIQNVPEHSDEIDYIISSLMNYVKEKDLKVFVFIVHDMNVFKTTVYEITSNDYKVKYYDVYTSRGNTIIPKIEEKLKTEIKKIKHI